MIKKTLDYELRIVKKIYELEGSVKNAYKIGDYRRLFKVNGIFLIQNGELDLVEVDLAFIYEHLGHLE